MTPNFNVKYIFFVFILMIFVSCKKETRLENDIASINIDINTERFDELVAKADLKDFSKLRHVYPFMFSESDTDSTWVETKNDTLQLQLFSEVNKVFSDFSETELDIESLFNHIKYYFPEFNIPRVITTTSYVDYRNRIVVTDTIDVIALDTYLGSDHEFYINIPKYIRKGLDKEQIVVDLASEYAKRYMYQKKKENLLDEMIYFGKQLYFKDVVVPFKTDAQRIGYTQDELDWAIANESYVWRYFVERELLFNTDAKLLGRFINPAPFSKFYLEEIDAASPGRLGQYIGWQIVRAYMEQNDVTLKDMLITSTEDIFNNSKFKPRK
ncbi:gliding motility lipoprotein GldB [Thalassobellus suaedae]|uniref:Gliding motility lipoprotein GldB n=1 Tax=Thalassobellus suaedae TaxID=3074124 RepID=A0ABY9XQL4_9FLAO|nr:gliding motility lipoprotein GldB [Flavobacteriaceae bacterium HL-DH14]